MYEKIFNMTFGSVFEKKSILIKALFTYLLVMIFIDYINADNIVMVEGKAEIKSVFIFLITIALSYLIYLMAAISTHRILILGENSIPTWGLFKFTKREWSFFKSGLFIGLIITATAIPLILIGTPFGKIGTILAFIVMLVVMSILISRFSLVFPTISVDKNMTLKEAWNYTKNYKLLVFVTVIAFPLIFSLAFGLIYGLAIDFLSKLLGTNLLFLNSILNIVIMVFTISALSATYEYIKEEHSEYFEPKLIEDTTIRETIVTTEENNHKIVIHDKNEIIFEELIDKLKLQYFKLGFTNIVIDKAGSWMIKNPEIEGSYVLLSHTNDEYIIEIYQGEMIDFLEDLINNTPQ